MEMSRLGFGPEMGHDRTIEAESQYFAGLCAFIREKWLFPGVQPMSTAVTSGRRWQLPARSGPLHVLLERIGE